MSYVRYAFFVLAVTSVVVASAGWGGKLRRTESGGVVVVLSDAGELFSYTPDFVNIPEQTARVAPGCAAVADPAWQVRRVFNQVAAVVRCVGMNMSDVPVMSATLVGKSVAEFRELEAIVNKVRSSPEFGGYPAILNMKGVSWADSDAVFITAAVTVPRAVRGADCAETGDVPKAVVTMAGEDAC